MKRIIGLDIGTGNICAGELINNEIKYFKIKDAFFKINPMDLMQGAASHFGEQMLKRSGANYIKIDGVLHILGDDAFKFANLFHKECLRPMSKGVLNPKEPISALMLKELIRGIAGEAESDEDVVYYCIPADPLDSEFDIVFHAQTIKQILEEFKFKNINRMAEGLAVVYSELEKENYTGIGISFGSGMCNVSFSFMGMPVFSFSISRGGDYLDEGVANAVNETKAAVQYRKEAGIDLLNPKDNIENAYGIYYGSLMDYLIKHFINLYETTDKKKLPNITEPITIVVSGGTSMAGNFTQVLDKKIRESAFPIPVGKVVQANQPLFAVSRGLYNAASML